MHDLSIMSRMGCRAAWADSTRGYSAGQHVQHEQHGHGSIYMESGTVGRQARRRGSCGIAGGQLRHRRREQR